MSNRQDFETISYPQCNKGSEHEGEPLSRVCIDAKCNNKVLICSICQMYDHRDHKTIPLKHFLNIINKERDILNSNSNPLFYINETEKYRNACLSAIRNKRKEINEKFNDIETKIAGFFDGFEQISRNLLHAQGPVQKVVNQFMYGVDINAQKISNQLKEILRIFQLDEDNKFSLKDRLEGLMITGAEKQRKLVVQLSNISTELDKSLQIINRSFEEKVTFSVQPIKFFWSQTMKGGKIKITDSIAEQTGMQSSGQRFILMQPALSLGVAKKKTWGMKIKKFGGWIGIGISLQKLITTANYHFNYTNIGHGSYLISTNGYSWSHSVKEFNSAFKCFTFAVNDTVYIEFDPIANKLRFRKNESTETKDSFELDIDTAPLGDAYHPSANLCSTNDSVQVIFPGKPLS